MYMWRTSASNLSNLNPPHLGVPAKLQIENGPLRSLKVVANQPVRISIGATFDSLKALIGFWIAEKRLVETARNNNGSKHASSGFITDMQGRRDLNIFSLYFMWVSLHHFYFVPVSRVSNVTASC